MGRIVGRIFESEAAEAEAAEAVEEQEKKPAPKNNTKKKSEK